MIDFVWVSEAVIASAAWNCIRFLFEMVAHWNAGLLFEEVLNCLHVVSFIGFKMIVEGKMFFSVANGEFVGMFSRDGTFCWCG